MIKKDKKPQEHQNIPLIIGLTLIAAFYIFMFGSRYVMKSNDLKYDLSAKEIGRQTIWVDSWTYDNDEKKMEVVLSVNGSFTITEYEVSSKVRTTAKTTEVPAEIVAQGTDLVVVHIENIPRLTQEIRLTVSSSDGEATFYDNINMVENTQNIQVLAITEYRIETRNRQITANLIHIEDLQKLIQENNKQIELYQAEILDIEAQKKYLTSTQIADASQQIKSIEQSIERLRKDNTSYTAEISEYEARNLNIQKEIKDMEEQLQ